MPSRLLPFLVAALVAALLPTAVAGARPLRAGSHGPRVVRLQHALHLHADGVFGPETRRAVKRFQRRHRLHADGIVGAGTWHMLRRARRARAATRSVQTAPASAARPRVASRGGAVRMAQRRLGLRADGIFGPGTARAVRRFQRRHGMVADGVVGPGTWSALGIGGRHPVLKRAHRAPRRGVGGLPALLRAVAAGNRIATLPYVYGGGHASFNAAGYDCSGSVSYVLHHAGLLGRPLDSGQLMRYGAAGPGRFITIYANPGHVYMVIRGRRFDTSGQSASGSRWSSEPRSTAGYVVRHPVGL